MKVNSTDMTKGDEDRWVHKWIYDRYKNKNKNTANPALINKRKKKGAENSDEEWRTQLRLHFFFAMMLKMLVMSSFSLTFTATSTI